MTRRSLILIAAAGSAALLLGALGFQYLGGLAPCAMCIWQRWPHLVAILAGALGLAVAGPIPPLLGGLGALATAAIGLYHTGVERMWWEGPTTCTSPNDIGGMSPEALMEQILAAPTVRCDEVAWAFAGLSMASWNAVISLVLAGIWLAALRKSLRA